MTSISIIINSSSASLATVIDDFTSVLTANGLTIAFSDYSENIVIVARDSTELAKDPVNNLTPEISAAEIPASEQSPEIFLNLGTASTEPSQEVMPEIVASMQNPEPTVTSPTLKTGIVFIKSLLPSEPVPFKCDESLSKSELHVSNVAYGKDLVTFSYRNVIFKFPVEQSPDATNGTSDAGVIRVVFTLDNTEVINSVFLKVVEDKDDNHVVFGNQDIGYLGLIEPSHQG